MTDSDSSVRHALVDIMKRMAERGLNRGTAGNASARSGAGLLVTPTGIPAEQLTPDSMVFIDATGTCAAGSLRPSSEWRMHAGILERRSDLNAVVHCHSRFATILACAGKPIPALHYMVAVSGGIEIPLAPYHPFGSHELAEAVVDTLQGRLACLMANHGLIVGGATLGRALAVAEEIEEQAAVYCGTLSIGGPKLLSEPQMQDVLRLFADYGQKPQP